MPAGKEFDPQNRGVLFNNDRKEKPNQPDYTGNIDVNGTEYALSAWIKTAKKGGKKFLSLAIRPKQDKNTKYYDAITEPTAKPAARHPLDDDDDTSIPF